MSGQDVERGTFSHRHAILRDVETEERINLLNHWIKYMYLSFCSFCGNTCSRYKYLHIVIFLHTYFLVKTLWLENEAVRTYGYRGETKVLNGAMHQGGLRRELLRILINSLYQYYVDSRTNKVDSTYYGILLLTKVQD